MLKYFDHTQNYCLLSKLLGHIEFWNLLLLHFFKFNKTSWASMIVTYKNYLVIRYLKKLLSLTMTIIIIIKTYQINTVHWKLETERWKKIRTIKDKLKYFCENLRQSRTIQDNFENPGHSRTFQDSGHIGTLGRKRLIKLISC